MGDSWCLGHSYCDMEDNAGHHNGGHHGGVHHSGGHHSGGQHGGGQIGGGHHGGGHHHHYHTLEPGGEGVVTVPLVQGRGVRDG